VVGVDVISGFQSPVGGVNGLRFEQISENPQCPWKR
jgi:hypothetical protein